MTDQITVEATHSDPALRTSTFGREAQRFRCGAANCTVSFGELDQLDAISLGFPNLKAGIFLERVPAINTPNLVELMQRYETTPTQSVVETTRAILNQASKLGVHIRSRLGGTAEEICANLTKLGKPESCSEQNSKSKARVEYKDLKLGPDGRNVRWVNVVRPNEQTLRSVSSFFKIDYTDLKRVIRNKHIPSSYRYDRYLFTCLDELEPTSKGNELKLKKHEVYAIMSDDYLITFCNRSSFVLDHVWSELAKRSELHQEISSSAQLFSRILGSTLHRNEEVFTNFKDRCNAFVARNGDLIPKKKVRDSLNEIYQSLNLALESVQRVPTTISALRERRNFFGADKPVESLERYSGIRDGLEREIKATQGSCRDIREAWETHMDHRKNDILAKIAYLGACTAIPSMVAEIIGIGVLSRTVVFTLALSFIVAFALVGNLFIKDLKNRKANEL